MNTFVRYRMGQVWSNVHQWLTRLGWRSYTSVVMLTALDSTPVAKVSCPILTCCEWSVWSSISPLSSQSPTHGWLTKYELAAISLATLWMQSLVLLTGFGMHWMCSKVHILTHTLSTWLVRALVILGLHGFHSNLAHSLTCFCMGSLSCWCCLTAEMGGGINPQNPKFLT